MFNLSLFNPLVLDYMIDLCCINCNTLLIPSMLACIWLN